MSVVYVGIIVLVVYTFAILGISWRSSRSANHNGSGKAFFLGNGTRTFVLLFSAVASAFSTWVFMGAPATTFENGHTWIALVTLYQMSMTFVCGYLGPRFWVLRQENDFVTQSDLLVAYYKSNTLRYVVGVCFIAGMVTGAIAQFKAVGSAIVMMTNGLVPFWAAALYIGIVVGIYVYLGGFHGEALVDTFQGILFSVILWGGLLVVLVKVGGLTGLFGQLAVQKPELLLYPGGEAYFDFKMALSFCLVALLGGMVHPGFWQRYYAAKDTKTLLNMSIWFPIMVSAGVTLSGGLVGLAANLFDLNLTDTSTVFQTLLSAISTPYWGVLVALGVLAAGMSTIAGNMNGSAMIISYDFIRFIKKDADEKKMMVTGRKCIIVLMVISYLLSLRTPSSVTMLIQLMAAFNLMALYPVIGIFIWKRATVAGCISAIVGGFATICVTNFIFKNPLGIVAGGWGFGVGLVLFIVVSLCTRPVSEEDRAKFMMPLKKRKSLPQTEVS